MTMMNKTGPEIDLLCKYLENRLGDTWKDFFNVEDCSYLLYSKQEYLLEYLDEE